MSFILLLAYLFCTFMRPQDWVPLFYGKPIIDILVVLTFAFLVIERLAEKKVGFLNVPQNYLIFGFYFAIAMSHVVNTYLFGLMTSVSEFFVIFVLFFLLLNGINTEIKLKMAVWFIILLTVVLVPQGMFQMEHGYGWAGQEPTYQGDTIRINWIGIFNDPNDLALAFVIVVGFMLAFLFGKSGYSQRIFSAGIICVLLYGIWMTNSRGGLLALMATIYFFFVRRTRKFFWGGIIGGLLAFAVISFGPSRAKLMHVDEASAYSRVELWYNGIVMLKNNPLFGVGYNMFTDTLAQTAHNSFILVAAELGFIGLFFWVSLIYCSFHGLSIIQENVPRLYNYALGLQSGLVGFCALAFFLSRSYVMIPYILFSLSGSLMYVAKQMNPELDFSFRKKQIKHTVFISLGVILLSYAVIKIGI